MCLAIPGKLEEILIENDLRIGRVNFGGVVKRVCLDYVPEIQVGDYAVVHVGFAISILDAETAEKTLEIFRQMGALDEELATEEEAFRRAAMAPQSACPDGSCANDGTNSASSADSTNSANSANAASPARPAALAKAQ
jgi:hydrogenase expression/formation protein HypC